MLLFLCSEPATRLFRHCSPEHFQYHVAEHTQRLNMLLGHVPVGFPWTACETTVWTGGKQITDPKASSPAIITEQMGTIILSVSSPIAISSRLFQVTRNLLLSRKVPVPQQLCSLLSVFHAAPRWCWVQQLVLMEWHNVRNQLMDKIPMRCTNSTF